MRTLINGSNLHIGGGVQVAASVVSELAEKGATSAGPELLVSSEVARNTDAIGNERRGAQRFKVCDVRGFDLFNRAARRIMNEYDVVFTLFGPLYRWRPPFRSIVGFAQPWIIYPTNECYNRLSLFQRSKTRFKFWLQRIFFKRADALVVELEHVKTGLIRELGVPAHRIHVVHNCLASIYRDEEAWQPLYLPAADCDLRLGFVGRNYPHKNTEIFPDIAGILSQQYDLEVRFYVTFTDEEWAASTPEFRAVCINVGKISAAQCPNFYRSLDAVVFPSLLECFSATPLEALAMERPLFASDRPFNRDVCGEHARYFDPLAPETAAKQIANLFLSGGPETAALRAARDHAIAFASPAERARQYLGLLEAN